MAVLSSDAGCDLVRAILAIWFRLADDNALAGRIARADLARASSRFRDAAVLYEEVLRTSPERGDIHIQCGHMFKEAGDLGSAWRHYALASRLEPGDADLQLQVGHFHKVAGQFEEAKAAYARAAALRPGWPEPVGERAALDRLPR